MAFGVIMILEKLRYVVMLQSQLGPRAGELVLQEESGVVSGYFNLAGHRNGFSGSVVEAGKYLITGALGLAADSEPYDALFTVRSGRLSGGVITSRGCWDLSGVSMRGSPEP